MYDLAWSPDGSLLATASRDSTVRTWEATLDAVLSAGRDRTVRVWGLADGALDKLRDENNPPIAR